MVEISCIEKIRGKEKLLTNTEKKNSRICSEPLR